VCLNVGASAVGHIVPSNVSDIPTSTSRLFAHFFARPPQILLATWTYILINDLFKKADMPFDMDDACRMSLSRIYLDDAVTHLATDQMMCASEEMEQAEAVYLQCDGGQDRAFVKIFS
jgi:hypothetical protein